LSADLRGLLNPSSIAVIGASDGEAKIGGRVFASLLRHNYKGALYPVNPGRATVHGLPAFPDLTSLPGPVDLAIVCIPAAQVPGIVAQCGAAGITNVAVMSSGFAEEGEVGAALQEELLVTATRAGVRLAGPNTEGFFNVSAGTAATFSPAINMNDVIAPRGRKVGIVAQSGGLGFALYNRGRRRGLAFSTVVSIGNQMAIDAADYCNALLDDPETDILLVFLESIKNAEAMAAVAEKAGRLGKPIIAAKAGSSQAGQRAASSHTGSLGGSDSAYNAFFERHGVIRVYDPETLLETAAMFARYPAVRGNRVAVISSSGGTAVWFADLCEKAGLELPEIDAERQARLMEFIPPYGSAANPIDVTGQGMRGFSRSLAVLQDSPDIDAIVIVGSFAHEGRLKAEGEEIARIANSSPKPVVLYTYTDASAASSALLDGWGLHFFPRMEGCANAIGASWRYYRRQEQDRNARLRPTGLPKSDAAQAMLSADPDSTIPEYRAKQVLALYGSSKLSERLVHDVAQARQAATEFGVPVAVKVQSAELPHKTEAGALRLNLSGPDAVAAAFEETLANARRHAPHAHIEGVLVQPMLRPGLEMIAGVLRDEVFGPVVMCGMGGIYVEVLKDVAFGLAPLTHQDALDMIGRLKAAALLDGVRGSEKLDRNAVADFLVRLSWLAHDTASVVDEIDVNPVLVYPDGEGIAVADALIVKRAEARQ